MKEIAQSARPVTSLSHVSREKLVQALEIVKKPWVTTEGDVTRNVALDVRVVGGDSGGQ
jgi:hypothetical protein